MNYDAEAAVAAPQHSAAAAKEALSYFTFLTNVDTATT